MTSPGGGAPRVGEANRAVAADADHGALNLSSIVLHRAVGCRDRAALIDEQRKVETRTSRRISRGSRSPRDSRRKAESPPHGTRRDRRARRRAVCCTRACHRPDKRKVRRRPRSSSSRSDTGEPSFAVAEKSGATSRALGAAVITRAAPCAAARARPAVRASPRSPSCFQAHDNLPWRHASPSRRSARVRARR